MKRYQLAVAAKEQEYVRRLAEYIRESPFGQQWQLIAFTNAKALGEHVEKGYTIDLLASQPGLYAELRAERMVAAEQLDRILTVALVLKRGESNGQQQELLQYQPLPSLLQGLLDIYAASAGHSSSAAAVLAPEEGAKVVTVYSSSGGTGKTALALHLTNAAGSQHCRTFYLNLERWHSAGVWLGNTHYAGAEEGLSELLYELKSQPEHAGQWLSEHRKRHSLLKGDFLSACTNTEDRITLGADDAARLLALIKKSGQYDLIIVDLDDGMDELHMTLLESSDQILWLVSDDEGILAKQRLAYRYGEQKWGARFQRISQRVNLIHNRAKKNALPPTMNRDGIPYMPIALPEAPEWHNATSAKLLSSPAYRAAAGRLMNYMMRGGEQHAVNG
ncbi:hypothetical protein [Paenibacillus harenae]|uniref:hypothetical protein n=1 Tax=Paenibacillus harenae TaxID=306543 RepID=UPI0027929174|nr:hypothetical protein [Paenibacillus harenae]MDQ0060956.1 Mrp family chromosome partitioning ATPase [Paenibacillus harenae]